MNCTFLTRMICIIRVYGRRLNDEPNDRVFRYFSIEDDFKAFHADPDYGEKYAERFASHTDLSFAERVGPDPWNVCPGKGYQDGVTNAGNLQDDGYLWYLGNAVYKTEYQYQGLNDLILIIEFTFSSFLEILSKVLQVLRIVFYR